MMRSGAFVRSLLAALLLAVGLAAPAAQAHIGAHAAGSSHAWASPVGSPIEQMATAAVTGHVLIFTETGTGGFTHVDAIENGTPKLKAALEAAGLTVDVKHTADNFVFSDASLAP